MKKILLGIIGAVLIIGAVVLTPVTTLAAPADDVLKGVTSAGGNSGGPTFETSVKNVVNILLYILGAIAVIMIIIGGIRYTISNGDSTAVKSAKDTILYAVIGLVVAIMAYAIVNFVVTAFGKP